MYISSDTHLRGYFENPTLIRRSQNDTQLDVHDRHMNLSLN